MASQSRPEPMNASPHHSKVKVTLTLSDPVYVSGTDISGKMDLESRTDLDSLLGIGVMMVELFAIQEVNSAEFSATSTFIHSRRIFQGPGLPPSNAVYSDHVPGAGELPLPAHHYVARRGQTTFFFRFPVPASSPSSIDFGPASVRYEIRASVSVAWRGDKRLVTDKREVKVVESWSPSNNSIAPTPQAVVITEGGQIWAQGTLTNDVVVGGESACIDLQLKNHTQRWTSGVTVTLTRELFLSASFLAGKSPPDISDVVTQVEFRGPEYSVPPGVEGIARLVIDIPRHSRGVQGGLRLDDNGRATENFFEVRCTLRLSIDMPPGSEDTVITLPLTIYHSLAVPEIPASPPRVTSSPYSYPAPVSSGLLLPPKTKMMPICTENQLQQYEPTWPIPPARPLSHCLPNQHLGQETYNWQPASYSYTSPMQRSISVGPPSQVPYPAPGLSTSYTPRLLPPPPIHASYTDYIHPGFPLQMGDSYMNSNHVEGAILPLTSQNIHLPAYYQPISPSFSSPSHAQGPLPPDRARPPPIQIPPLPNPHDSQGVLHSPRPVPSPKPSFLESFPKSDNVTKLERMADEVGKQVSNLSLDLPKGDACTDVRGPQDPKPDRRPDLSVVKTLPAPPVPSDKDEYSFSQRPRVDALFATEGIMGGPSEFPSSTDNISRAPPTPPIAAITPVKFPKAPTEQTGLGANLGRDASPENGLDALERRLLAEVGTRRFDVEERPHVRSVVQPITIPPSGPPLDTVNDSAISSLTLADREDILKENMEREQEQDRDSDERTQHLGGGGQSPSDDDRDARTQKGKSSRKLRKGKNSEEDLERAGRRRERKKVKDEEGRKLRKEAKGRVAAWLGDIDVSVAPAMDDSTFMSPTASHFVPITESASFTPAPAETTGNEVEEHRGGDTIADKDVSASPNPRSSGFVTISSLNAVVPTNGSSGQASSFKPSPRRSSVNDFRQTPTATPERPTTAHRPPMSRSASAEVKRSSQSDVSPPQPPTPPPQPTRLFPGRLPRFPPKPSDPEVKYDVRSARGGRGGKVTQVASLWAAKASANADAKVGEAIVPVPRMPRGPPPAPPMMTPAVRKPMPNVFKRSPNAMHPLPGVGGVTPPTPPNRNGRADARASPGTRQVARATKATTVPAVLSSSHAVPMLSSTASLARVKAHSGQGLAGGGQQGYQGPARPLPPMISETISDVRSTSKGGASKPAAVGGGRGTLGDLAFGQARLRDLIKKYQG